jgi:hypothetical protein
MVPAGVGLCLEQVGTAEGGRDEDSLDGSRAKL